MSKEAHRSLRKRWNKRGQTESPGETVRGGVSLIVTIVVSVAVIFVLAGLIGLFAQTSAFQKIEGAFTVVTSTNELSQTLSSLSSQSGIFQGFIGKIIDWVLHYGMGINLKTSPDDSTLVILVAMWFITVIILKEMVEMFGMLGKESSEGVAIGLTVIMANIHFFSTVYMSLMEIFAFLASFAVIGVLLSMLCATLVANLGVSQLGKWLIRRKMMMEAMKIEGGGDKLRATVGALLETGEALQRNG